MSKCEEIVSNKQKPKLCQNMRFREIMESETFVPPKVVSGEWRSSYQQSAFERLFLSPEAREGHCFKECATPSSEREGNPV